MTEASPLFQINDLRFQRSKDFALEIQELTLPKRACTAILGHSGSGKSTLLSLLARLEREYFDPPSVLEGEIIFHDEEEPVELLSMTEQALMKAGIRGQKIGFVFQREGLFSELSILENLTYPLTRVLGLRPEEALLKAEAMLDAVGLSGGLQVNALSGGQRKRLALGRALVMEPQVLLLDEPLTGLDPGSLQGLRALLQDFIERGRQMIMVTHQEEDVQALASHLVFMSHGKVLDSGPMKDRQEAFQAFFQRT